jgi:membrane protease YdiL (CAAX protease family)
LDSDTFFFLVSLAVALAVAYGLVYWAFRAKTDRSARVGLYLVYGFPGILLTVAGLALTVYSRGNGPLLLALGLGLTLPLIKRFRVAIARVTPIDPESPVDMSALSIFLAVLGLLIAITWEAPAPDEVTNVNYGQLIVQLLGWIGLSYVIVGTGLWRTFDEANKRLGLRRLTLGTVGVSVAAFFVAMIVNGVAGALTAIFQPSTSDEIERGLQELTGDFQSPLGAILIAVSAGVGEELFFRGALQPKFGIVLTSVCFALLHTNYGLSFVTLGVFGMGMVFGYLRQRYGTVAAMITHGLVNLVAVLVQTYT